MEKINIVEILKDCPKGMELNCLMYDNLYFDEIDEDCRYPVGCYTIHNGHRISANFTKFGEFNNYGTAKCVIFPKGKTTWEGFVPPCEFKDGDIVATTDGFWIGITAGGKSGEFMPTYCVIKGDGEFEVYLNKKETWQFHRLATEEEKQKLFDAIKASGYNWNAETKTLEKLIEPNFKVGDTIQDNGYEVEITKVNVEDELYEYKSINTKIIGSIAFNKQDYWELVSNKFDVTTLKPFKSEVLVRDNVEELWFPCFFGGLSDINDYPYRTVGGEIWKCCIPYEGNEHLLGKKEDCDNYYKNW